MNSTAVIIARFQTPYLHDGHRDLITTVAEKHVKIIILLGVTPVKGSRRNPYDFYTREQLIKREYPDVIVLPLSDHPSDKIWSYNLDKLLIETFSNENFSLYGSRDSFIPYYTGKFKTIELNPHGDYNATEIRAKYAHKVQNSEDFRAGILYAYNNQYTKVIPTVDIAVFKNDKTEILLGKKENNMKWRLIGGYVDTTDSCYELAAKRELKEEAGNIEVNELSYEMSYNVPDWRYQNESDKIITTVYSADYMHGAPEANDDIVEVEWLEFKRIPQLLIDNEITPEHIHIFEKLVEKYLK